jgi:hypothetical protein
MVTNDEGKILSLTPDELAQIGNGALSYIREVEGKDVLRMVGPNAQIQPNAKLYCLYNANGAPISVSGSPEAAAVSAYEHELLPISVH